MQNRLYYYHNPSLDPHHTLAVEEYMLEHIQPGDVVMYLYAHEDSVIIGKHQNAWAECRHEKLLADGGKLARRISGGGAVFHDLGNLNFSFIAAHDTYDLHRQLKVMLDAVNQFGIHAEFSGRNDIMADGRKFSGNAFCKRRNGSFHHGTILIDSDMNKLSKYLAVSKDKIESKGISSVRARVVNLHELNANVTPDNMKNALFDSYRREYGEPQPYPFTHEALSQIEMLTQRNAGWKWLFGESPQFDITMKTRFAWGGIELLANLKDAIICKAQLFSDAMDADFIDGIAPSLVSCAFRSYDLAKRIRAIPHTQEQETILSDIAEYIEKQNY